ncbi:copper resistance CopC family protein [Mycobacterium sp. UM_NYF]|uniref:copper resistance CopC family protein n=1 Tax=Mycolicibacterium cosmeticum TaxID=258533 RepID=UPI00062BFEDF
MRWRALGLIGAVLAVAAMLGAGVASAHAVRVSSDPAPDAVLTAGPARITATFNEQLQTAFASMTLVGPDGNLWSTGEARVQGPAVEVDLRPLGPVGTYTANYRVTSADGHVVNGSWSFRLSVAGTGTPGPPVAAPRTGDEEFPIWPFVVFAVAIVGAGAWWSRRRRT